MATTTTTTSAPAAISTTSARLGEVPATDIGQGDGIEPRETGHVDPATTGTASSGGAEDGGRAHRLVWLDPPELAVHPRNIRDDPGGAPLLGQFE